ncbi:MAG TPA: nitroreductase/quinone reductase family protein [Actinomycetota bacterium]|nr:nitroreductase/quinone reductase family protein [Actinomycetota bacterium]
MPETVAVRARVPSEEERDRIREERKRRNPAFAEYERRTRRRIPVVILERV